MLYNLTDHLLLIHRFSVFLSLLIYNTVAHFSYKVDDIQKCKS